MFILKRFIPLCITRTIIFDATAPPPPTYHNTVTLAIFFCSLLGETLVYSASLQSEYTIRGDRLCIRAMNALEKCTCRYA